MILLIIAMSGFRAATAAALFLADAGLRVADQMEKTAGQPTFYFYLFIANGILFSGRIVIKVGNTFQNWVEELRNWYLT